MTPNCSSHPKEVASVSDMIATISPSNPVIGWWSGGADSALACRFCIDWFGAANVRIIFIDTFNEDDDTYRFKNDCAKWYQKDIETISTNEYDSIQDVWETHLTLNTATGAKCSTQLKRRVRLRFQYSNLYSFQAFGFDITEIDRARNMKRNNPDCKPIFPLIYNLNRKGEAIKELQKAGIELPIPYRMGYSNNNCFKTGCVQGGIGYWQKIKEDTPQKFEAMAEMEHKLTDLKGEPVTICKDQSKNGGLVFLKPHPKYPLMKDISMMKGRQPEGLLECNGFCQPNIHNPLYL